MRTSDRPAGELRIAYILNQFPSVSETFILREMAQLEKRGVRILPCALVPPGEDDPIHEAARPFVDRVVYRPPPGSAVSAYDWLASCSQWPKGGASATMLALGHSLRRPLFGREMCTSLAAACHFARALRGERIQHIHAHFGSRPATVGMLLAEITGLSLSLSLHARDIFTDESILLTQKIMEAEFATACTRYGLDRLVATQPAAGHSRLHLVRHGIDLTQFTTGHKPVGQPIIAIVGRLVEKKGHQVLFRAVQMLRNSWGPVRVAVAGDGPLRRELASMAETLGISPLVTFCGALSQDEVEELLVASRLLAVPSVVASDGDRDGLPNVILEAAAIGTPIVASDMSAIPEFIVQRRTGLLVPSDDPRRLADAIAAVLRDPAGAAAMGREARRQVIAEYDLGRNVQALEALFRETLARRLDDSRRRPAAKPSPEDRAEEQG